MTAPLEATGATAQSVGDYLVTSMRPNLHVFKERVAGLTIRHRVIHLFETQLPADFHESVILSQKDILGAVSKTPAWFNQEVFLGFYLRKLDEYLEKDPQLEKALSDVSKRHEVKDKKSATSWSEAMKLFSERITSSFLASEQTDALQFLKSDLGDDFYYLTSAADRLIVLEFNLLALKGVGFQTQLSLTHEFLRIKKTVENFRNQMTPLMVTGRLTYGALNRVRFYVNVSNSLDLDDFYRFKPYLRRNVDERYLKGLLQELSVSSERMQHEVALIQKADTSLYRRLAELRQLPLEESTRGLQEALALTVMS